MHVVYMHAHICPHPHTSNIEYNRLKNVSKGKLSKKPTPEEGKQQKDSGVFKGVLLHLHTGSSSCSFITVHLWIPSDEDHRCYTEQGGQAKRVAAEVLSGTLRVSEPPGEAEAYLDL